MRASAQYRDPGHTRGDEGFMLIAAIVMIFMVLLVLSIAAPTMAKQIQHDREAESARRAQQYVRAIRIFYLANKTYPTSVEQLEKTNNRRFLRQRYIDPLTGKADWRLIHVGENQTTVKGFFGEDLPGLPAMSGGGLGSASGMASATGGATSTPGSSSLGSTGSSAFGGSSSTPGGTSSSSAFGSSSPGTGQSGTGATGSSGSTGIASQDATTFTGSAGPIIGVGSARSGEAMLVVNEQTTYETWEFLYDPRIEQLYAKSTLLGGVASSSATSSSSSFGNSTGTGAGNSTGAFGTSIGPGATPTGASGAGGTAAPTGSTPP